MRRILLFISLLFIVINSYGQSIVGFTLINSDTNEDLMEITEGAEINLLELPSESFNIRANVTGVVNSVRLQLSGSFSNARTENVAPYALFGDNDGNYNGQDLGIGTYIISGTPYSDSNLGGDQGEPFLIAFSLSESISLSNIICKDITVQLNPNGKTNIDAEDVFDGFVETSEVQNMTVVPNTFSIDNVGENIVTLSVLDTNGKNSMCTARVIVEDNVAPTVVCKSSVIIGLDENGEAYITPLDIDDGSNDAAGISSMSVSPSFFNNYGDGLVTLKVVDNNGNESTCNSQVILDDIIAPVISCPSDINVSSLNDNSVFIDIEMATATDNYWPTTNVSASRSDGLSLENPFPMGTTIITWTASDQVSNVSECTQTIVVEETPSVLSLVSFTLVNADTNEDIMPISDSMIFNILELPTTNLNIRGNTSEDVGSVRLELKGALSNTRTENVAPYALFGDNNGNYNGQDFGPGEYEIMGTPYSGSSLGGVQGIPLTVNFSISEEELFRPFVTTWKTDNQGLSEDNQITIPTYPGETYNYTVDWGDGIVENNYTGDATHTYLAPGIYTVSIVGQFPRIYFYDDNGLDTLEPDKGKLLTVENWGSIQWASMDGAFTGCYNLDVIASDFPDLLQVTSMANMFAGCSNLIGNNAIGNWDVSNVNILGAMFAAAYNFNIDIGNWNVGQVTEMGGMFTGATAFNQNIESWDMKNVVNMPFMFLGAANFNQDISSWNLQNAIEFTAMFEAATAFNQPIGNWNMTSASSFSRMFANATAFDQDLGSWDISNVLNMSEMFLNTGLSITNYDATLNGWSNQPLQSNILFDGGNSQYCLGEAARQKMMDDNGWIITDGGISDNCPDLGRPFITTWKTDNEGYSEDSQIRIPTYPRETYNYTVDWGDGNFDTGVTGDITHTYSVVGIYEVSITGEFPGIFVTTDENNKLLNVKQWGDILWKSFEKAFYQCHNLDVIATDVPNLSQVSSMKEMFGSCTSLIGNSSFENWDLQSVENMEYTFRNTSNFNQNINNWNVGSVKLMTGMFSESSFNQPLDNWNVANVTNFAGMFFGASNFNQNIGNWDMSNATSINAMFYDAISFNQDISAWDVGKVEAMANTFVNAISFNQDLANWDISKVNIMADMFIGAGLSVENYDNTLIGWSALESIQNGVVFHGGNSQYCLAENAKQKLIDDYGWIITDGGKSDNCANVEVPFVTTWKTDNEGASADNQITIPTYPGETYNYSVDWGDGTFDTGVSGDITHSYDVIGTYQVSISGNFPRIYFNGVNYMTDGNKEKILTIDQWGGNEWTSMDSAFRGCSNLDIVANDMPNLTYVLSTSSMFTDCSSLVGNQKFNDWDVSEIVDLSNMFSGASIFNQNIGSWNVSKATSLLGMFNSAKLFNQDIGGWNLGEVIDTSFMFSYAESFNQDIGVWNVSKVKGMIHMFSGAVSFNQDIGNWNVGTVINMGSMFSGATSFDRKIGNWDVGNVIDMNGMFNGAESFNQDIGNWNVSNVRNMLGMFNFAYSFNQPLNNWDVSNVENMMGMFSMARSFNQPLDNWDVSNVTNMSMMFNETKLNYPLNNWNVSNVTTMSAMFSQIKEFNQPLDDWDVSTVTDMSYMFIGAENFDQNLGTWDVGNVTDMSWMFNGASLFNQDIGSWDVGKVTNMASMFENAFVFNQDIGNWNVGNVEYMQNMFEEGISFDQDLGNWNIGNVLDLDSMFHQTELSTENYDAILNGWSSLPSLRSDMIFDAGNSQYCLGETGRNILINNYGWEIIDADKNCENMVLSIIGFVLVNADSNEDIMVIENGTQIDLLSLPTNSINIRATTTDDVNSVRLSLTGTISNTRTENVAPFALFGDNSGDYFGQDFVLGNYSLEATPYSEVGSGGTMGTTVTTSFSFVGSGVVSNKPQNMLNVMSIYPNPAVSQVTATFDEPSNVKTIMVFDVLGRLVQTYEAKEIKNGEGYEMDINFLQPGTYIIKTLDESGNNFQKQMVIEK
ncbi:surface protein [Saonia flava]|uniref:Surface protein n=1 Tax=Saonia flava TaxID=523696 RepID=A0A846QQP4_9FLAO|nr:BspA family leucine-rich repeat surface protein [Saonia flava]NJB70428.1 surface protein [Saonia flava]